MDLFFNIDWQQLKNLTKDLELTVYNSPEFNGKAKLELTKLLYLIDCDLTEIKTKLKLPLLNSSIRSESVTKSFAREDEYFPLFQEDEIQFNNFFRQNDYQYWLLVYLLIRNNHIRSNQLTLFKIIDEFIERVKDASFQLEDIELTDSGATRCKTNIRFAFNDLKEMGLVYLYDKRRKNSWTLTFIGFFLAASFCLKPVDKKLSPLGRKITRFNQSTYYHRINTFILERTKELSDPKYFHNLLEILKVESLSLKELEKGPEIFGLYYNSVCDIFENEKNDKERIKKLSEYLVWLDSEYPLNKFMEELSTKFDAEAFFEELINSVNNSGSKNG